MGDAVGVRGTGRRLGGAFGLPRLRSMLTARDVKTGPFAGAAIVAARLIEVNIFASGSLTNPPWEGFGWVPDWIRKEAQYAEIPVWKTFLETVVVPNMTVFLWLTFLIGLFIALAMLLGAFVGITGGITTLWAFVIALGSYPVPSDEPFYVHMLFVALPLLIWALRGGRVLGLDALLRPRFARSPKRSRRWLAEHAM